MTLAIYPGTFDPVTNGHLNLIERGLLVFDDLIVAVATNIEKTPLFDTQERVEMIRESVGDEPRIQVETFHGLLVNYAKERKAAAILRGLRAVSDFEFEFQMAHMNRRLADDVETLFLMASEEFTYLSSRLVKEVALLGGDVTGLVSPEVARALEAKRAEQGP